MFVGLLGEVCCRSCFPGYIFEAWRGGKECLQFSSVLVLGGFSVKAVIDSDFVVDNIYMS